MTGLPFPAQREAFLNCDLEGLLPILYLVLAEPVEFLQVERGDTRFPQFTEAGLTSVLECFLSFLQLVFEALPEAKILPETRTFWESAELEVILIHNRLELDNRLSWLEEIVARDLWEGFR